MYSLQKTFLNEPEFICLHKVKWFQVFLFKINNIIQDYLFFCTVKWFQVLLYNSINSIFQLS